MWDAKNKINEFDFLKGSQEHFRPEEKSPLSLSAFLDVQQVVYVADS